MKPGEKLGVEELVGGFERLGEPPQVTAMLRQILVPLISTYPT